MIPRRFIRTVPERTPEHVEHYWLSFKVRHPGWEMVTLRDPLEPLDFPIAGPYWPQCTTGAQRAGLIRLEALWTIGGIYVDSDVECFRSWASLRGVPVFAGWEDRDVVPDAVLGSVAGHPLISRCLTLAVERLKGGAWESGPGVTTEVLAAPSEEVLLLPPCAFYPVHYTRKEELAGFLPDPWTFGLHHWHASWVPTERRRARR